MDPVNDVNRDGNKHQKGSGGQGINLYRDHALDRPVEKTRHFKETAKRLGAYLAPKKWTLVAVVFFAFFSTIFEILSPMILGMGIDRLFQGFMAKMHGDQTAAIDYGYIVMILLILIGLYLISSLFAYIMEYIMAEVAQMTVYDMRQEISQKFTKLPFSFYDGQPHGEVLSRVTNDMDNIADSLHLCMIELITAVITIIGALVMMLVISPILTSIALVSIPVIMLVTKAVTTRSKQYFKDQQKAIGELNGHIEEMFTGQKEVKAFGYEEKSRKRFERVNEELCQAGWKALFISGIILPIMEFINMVSYVIIAVIGGILITRSILSLGQIQAFVQYSMMFGQPIVETASIANIFQSTIASAERVFDVLDEMEEVADCDDPVVIESPAGKVDFEHVRFGYADDKILMPDMTFHVKPGQTVAIVGPSGAGKTTLVSLLMRFYEVQDGAIKVDGIDIRDMTRGGLRNLFGMVLQETWLFKGTIRDNIAYACDGATDADVIRAAKVARADHFIRTLPDGYDTVLNEDVGNISQGQKQLLTIARVILANPTVLILDEATSYVDTRTEQQIQNAMENLMDGRTSFVIAHRLSTIKHADVILVMNDGDIIETGTHESLLKQGGLYSELYNAKFTSKEENVDFKGTVAFEAVKEAKSKVLEDEF